MVIIWYEDDWETDPYNRHKATISGHPDWRLKRKWDGSRDEFQILYKGHHMGYVKENAEDIERFISEHTPEKSPDLTAAAEYFGKLL